MEDFIDSDIDFFDESGEGEKHHANEDDVDAVAYDSYDDGDIF